MSGDPPSFYAILFRAVRGAILVILNKINLAVSKESYLQIIPDDLQFFFMIRS